MRKVNILLLFCLLFCCKKEETIQLMNDRREEYKILFERNYVNLKNGYPFFVIRLTAVLLLNPPVDHIYFPENYIKLKYADVLFPVVDVEPVNNFFYVRTVNNEFGWIYSNYGISLNYDENEEFYFFNENNYLKKYKETNGNVDNSTLIVFAKNIVPLLLNNYRVEGWFYPSDYKLAYEISEYIIKLAEEKNTYFQSATILFDWNVNEYVVASNLLADSCHKLGMLDKAEEIHLNLIKKHFWKYYDNSRIGGLNSVIKLEMIYLDMLKTLEKGTKAYNAILEKMVTNLLIIGDNYNDRTVIDKKWHLTAAEWSLDILLNSLKDEDFYYVTDFLKKRTTSTGFYDMINLYIALKKYKEGKEEEALKILSSLKEKKHLNINLRVTDWLYEKKIVPESVIYQYKF